MKTRVYVTVDVECAEERTVRGRPQPPLGYDLRMWGSFRNQREDLGLPLLVRELDAFGFKGTFFVEPFGSSFFGADGLRAVCTYLREHGHDVQVHAHPTQRNVAWRAGGERLADDIAAYPLEQQTDLLREARALLVGAGVPAGELLAYRAGNFGAGNDTWSAMAAAGLRLSSNYNPCYFGKNCKMRFGGARAGLFASPAEGVWELPVTCFTEAGPPGLRGGARHLQVTAVTAEEMIACLERCRALGVGEVTIVTHSFELYFIDSIEDRLGRINQVNLARMRSLLRWLHDHDDRFEVDTCGALAARLATGHQAVETDAPAALPPGDLRPRIRRFAEQAKKRAAARIRVM